MGFDPKAGLSLFKEGSFGYWVANRHIRQDESLTRLRLFVITSLLLNHVLMTMGKMDEN